MIPNAVLEKIIERRFEKDVKKRGGLALKLRAHGNEGIMDRIVIMPIRSPAHRKIVEKYVTFNEIKRPAPLGVLSDPQKKKQKLLRRLGYKVNLITEVLDD